MRASWIGLHGIIAWRGAFRKQESGTGARETAGDGERYGRERPGKKRETSDTGSRDFPVTSDALHKTHAGKGDAFIVKLVPR